MSRRLVYMILVLVVLCGITSSMSICILEFFTGDNTLSKEVQILGIIVSSMALILVTAIATFKVINKILDEK